MKRDQNKSPAATKMSKRDRTIVQHEVTVLTPSLVWKDKKIYKAAVAPKAMPPEPF